MTGLAVVVRLFPWRASISPTHVLFIQPDAYYHLRRATIMARNFPFYPTIDRYMAYPFGAECPWPPLYDFAIAAVSLLLGWGDPSDRTIQLVTAFFPPVLAGFSILTVYLLARELFGQRVALVAAFFAVLMPGQLSYSVVGSGDHHVAEVLFSTLHFYLLVKALRQAGLLTPSDAAGGGSIGPPTGEGRGAGTGKTAVLAGAALAAATLIWQGSMVFATLGMSFVGMVLIRHREARDAAAAFRIGSTSAVTAAAIVAAGRGIIPPATGQTVFGFGFFSWFQPVYLLALAAALSSVYLLVRSRAVKQWTPGRLAVGAGVVLLSVAGVALAVPPFRQNLVDAFAFVARKHPYLASINEFQPLYDRFPWQGTIDLRLVYDLLYMSGFLIPLLLCVRILAGARKRGVRNSDLFFLVWTVVLGILTLQQRRWSNAYSANMAVGIGVLVVAFLDRTRVGQRLLTEFLQWRMETGKATEAPGFFWRAVAYSRRFPKAFTVFAATIFFIPYYIFVFSLVFPSQPVMGEDAYNSLVWIRLNTPETSHLWNPTRTPEYSILAPWDLGHYLQYISRRPTVANNFGYQLRGEGLDDSVRYLLMEEEKDVAALCERRGVRYIVATDVFGGMDSMGPIAGVDFVRDFMVPSELPGHPGGAIPFPSERYYRLVSQRMYMFDSSATPDSPGLSHFRLIFESRNGSGAPYLPPGTKICKVFEKVRGATVSGRATPGMPVSVSVRMMTNFDRFFDYVALARADEKGTFRAVVPYASEGTGYPVRAVSQYLAMTEKEAVFFAVTEQDVTEGREVRIKLKGKGKAADHPAVAGPPPARP